MVYSFSKAGDKLRHVMLSITALFNVNEAMDECDDA